jgi:hypothetical protein
MDRTRGGDAAADVQAAEIMREYGPFPDAPKVGGVTFDGTHVWFAAGDALRSFDPSSGRDVRAIDVAADAGTAFDGRYLYQLADSRIQKVDPATGEVVATLPAPGKGGDSGLTWAEGTLWVGQYRDRHRDGRDLAHDRVEPLRHRRHVGRRRTLARHVGRRPERDPAHRPRERQGSGTAHHARGRWRVGPRVRWRRLVLRR